MRQAAYYNDRRMCQDFEEKVGRKLRPSLLYVRRSMKHGPLLNKHRHLHLT